MLKEYYAQTKKTRSSAVARIADSTSCQWPYRSSKVDNFHFIWKPIFDFLSMINSNLGPISHRLATIARNHLQGHAKSVISI